jgi:translation initiation factor 1 (eIF-1/SUI1)
LGDKCLSKGKKIEIRENNVKGKKKQTTINFNGKANGNIKDTKRVLQKVCACGGTSDENTIMLQGWHSQKVKDTLAELGFNINDIEMISRPVP